MLCRVAFGVVAVGLLVSFTQSASAQQKGPPGGTVMKVNGKVKEVVAGQGLLVTGNAGETWAVFFDKDSRLSLEGTASPDFLAPGSFIQLDTELDAKGQPVGEVKKLQIVQQDNINQPGIFSEDGPDAKPGAGGKFFVRGTVKTNKGKTLTVVAGGKQLTFKIADGVSMPVTIGEWALAKPGDTITNGDGRSYAQQGAPAGSVVPVYCEAMIVKAISPIERKKKGRR